MLYQLRRPCTLCPFRTDIEPYLGPRRAAEIVQSLVLSEFPCHETTVDGEDEHGSSTRLVTDRSQHCAGALIMLEHVNRPSQMMRICERLGIYDRTKLDMSAPVHTSPRSFLRASANARLFTKTFAAIAAKLKPKPKPHERTMSTDEETDKKRPPSGPRAVNLDPRAPADGGQVIFPGVDTDDGPEHPLYTCTPRNTIVDPSLEESIYQDGIKTPVKGRRNGENYEIGVGHRRLIALRAANIRRVADGKDVWPLPFIIERLTDKQWTSLILTENAQREDEDPIEKARLAIRLESLGATEQEVMTACNLRSKKGLEDLKRLLDTAPEVQTLVRAGVSRGGINPSTALELVHLPHKEQAAQVKDLIDTAAAAGKAPTAREARKRARPEVAIKPSGKETNRLIEMLKRDSKLPRKQRYFEQDRDEPWDANEFALAVANILSGKWKANRIKGLSKVFSGDVTPQSLAEAE